jgi:hypothetical protein
MFVLCDVTSHIQNVQRCILQFNDQKVDLLWDNAYKISNFLIFLAGDKGEKEAYSAPHRNSPTREIMSLAISDLHSLK